MLLSTISVRENLNTVALETRPRNKKTSFKKSFFCYMYKESTKVAKVRTQLNKKNYFHT